MKEGQHIWETFYGQLALARDELFSIMSLDQQEALVGDYRQLVGELGATEDDDERTAAVERALARITVLTAPFKARLH